MLTFSLAAATAQQALRLRVTDSATAQPLPGATVRLSDGKYTTTDADGYFVIAQAGQMQTILVSYTGYLSREIVLDGTITGDVALEAGKMLSGVVVSSTRGRRTQYELPLRADVVDNQKIQEMPSLSVDDYLRTIPGVSVSRGASFLGAATISLRGTGNEPGRTLVMIDGVPVNKSDGGSVNWNAIDPTNVEQIEVLKGPGSSIYGGNAMGGIINIITPLPVKPLQGSISQEAGSFNTWNTRLNAAGRHKAMFWGVSGRYRQSDGYVTNPIEEVSEFSVASFLEEYQLGLRAGVQPGPRQLLDVSASIYQGRRGTGSKFTGYGFANEDLAAPQGAYNEYASASARATYRGALAGNLQLTVSAFGQRENYSNIRESVRSNRITRYDVLSVRDDMGLLSSLHIEAGSMHRITTGVDLRHGSVDGNDKYLTSSDVVINRGKLAQAGLYVQDEIRLPGSAWSFLAGLRFDHASFFGGQFLVENPGSETAFLGDFSGSLPQADFSAISPRLSAQYQPGDSYRVFAGVSKGFRPPVLDELCRTGRISGGMKIANPSLRPEYLFNVETGADFFPGRMLSFSPTVYFSRGKDYHAYISTGDSLMMNNRMRPIRKMDNIGRVEIMGGELAASFNPSRAVSLNMSYSRINTRILEFRVLDQLTEDNLHGNELVYQPASLFNTSFVIRHKWVNLFAAFNYKGSQWLNEVNTQTLEAFNYTDVRIWKELAGRITLEASAHNLFDQQYVDSRSMTGPGRLVMFGLKVVL